MRHRCSSTDVLSFPSNLLVYRIRRCMSHPPGVVFQARLFDNQEGAHTERHAFGKLWTRCFQRRPFRHRHDSSCGDIEHVKSAQGCVIYTGVYGAHALTCIPVSSHAKQWKRTPVATKFQFTSVKLRSCIHWVGKLNSEIGHQLQRYFNAQDSS